MFKILIHTVILAFFGLFFSSLPKAAAVESEEGHIGDEEKQSIAALKNQYLPSGTLPLELVLYYALKDNSQMRLIKSELIAKDSASLRAEAALDPVLKVEGSFVRDRSENSGGLFSPTDTKVIKALSSLSKNYTSGTTVFAEWQSQQNQLDFPSVSGPMATFFTADEEFFESRLSFGVRQQLWRNQNGEEIKGAKQAGKHIDLALLKAASGKTEDWVLGVVDLYRNAWLAKEQVLSVMAHAKKQRDFLRVVKIKYRRGTAVRSDLLQIEASLLALENQVRASKKQLLDLWEGLIINLNLPRVLLKLDPMSIPLLLDESAKETELVCGQKQASVPNSAVIESLEEQIKAQEELLKIKKGQTDPSLYIQGQLSGNGINNSLSGSLSEMGKYDHPRVALILGLDMVLNQHGTQADYLDVLKQKTQLEIARSQQNDLLLVNQSSACRQFALLSEQLQGDLDILKKQKQRADLEQERFEVGKIDAYQVIQAENDVISSSFKVNGTRAQLSLTLWQVKKYFNQLAQQIEHIQSQKF